MLTRFHRMILRLLPGPFLGWLGILMFLLLMQFLIRYLPDLVGKGLPLAVVLELIVYNLAYMLVLAVPMSVLIATLMTFGRLAESNAYAVIKGAGVSLPQLVWPVLVAGALLAGGMWYFNNEVLPEANFRARNLWWDIRKKKPGFELRPGVFYEGLNNYSILVQHIPPDDPNRLQDVLIYDYTEGSRQRVDIKARQGRIRPLEDGQRVDLILHDGEIHRRNRPPSMREPERYERLAFERYRLRLDLSDFIFERSDPDRTRRSDRTMRSAEMLRVVDSLEQSLARERQALLAQTLRLATARDTTSHGADRPPALPTVAAGPDTLHRAARAVLRDLPRSRQYEVYDVAVQRARQTRTEIDNARRTLQWQEEQANRYRVEIHKKRSIALACLIFVLVGAPLGLSIRRGGLGTAGALALGLFLFYWVTLVQGEKLADRNLLSPWVGMWAANLVTLVAGLWLVLYVTLDLRATPRLRTRLATYLRRRRGQSTDAPPAAGRPSTNDPAALRPRDVERRDRSP
ncbi:MAG: permease [Rhodothermaceae bacterium]|nr:MAG: permease [Rhodothermaceae bacterium]